MSNQIRLPNSEIGLRKTNCCFSRNRSQSFFYFHGASLARWIPREKVLFIGRRMYACELLEWKTFKTP
jgi:hypothetical protein